MPSHDHNIPIYEDERYIYCLQDAPIEALIDLGRNYSAGTIALVLKDKESTDPYNCVRIMLIRLRKMDCVGGNIELSGEKLHAVVAAIKKFFAENSLNADYSAKAAQEMDYTIHRVINGAISYDNCKLIFSLFDRSDVIDLYVRTYRGHLDNFETYLSLYIDGPGSRMFRLNDSDIIANYNRIFGNE